MKTVKSVVSETAQRQNQIQKIEYSLRHMSRSKLMKHLAVFLYNSNQVREDMMR